jgi:DNA-binding transcriptional LysR family regulator
MCSLKSVDPVLTDFVSITMSTEPVHGRIMANNGTALMQAAAQGMGITRQPDFIAEAFLERGDVVSILTEFEPPPMGIFAVLPSNRYIPHRVRVLMDFLSQALQTSQA